MAISGVNAAGLTPGWAMTLANQRVGSGRNWNPRPTRGRLSRPISHAEINEMKTPSAWAAWG